MKWWKGRDDGFVGSVDRYISACSGAAQLEKIQCDKTRRWSGLSLSTSYDLNTAHLFSY